MGARLVAQTVQLVHLQCDILSRAAPAGIRSEEGVAESAVEVIGFLDTIVMVAEMTTMVRLHHAGTSLPMFIDAVVQTEGQQRIGGASSHSVDPMVASEPRSASSGRSLRSRKVLGDDSLGDASGPGDAPSPPGDSNGDIAPSNDSNGGKTESPVDSTAMSLSKEASAGIELQAKASVCSLSDPPGDSKALTTAGVNQADYKQETSANLCLSSANEWKAKGSDISSIIGAQSAPSASVSSFSAGNSASTMPTGKRTDQPVHDPGLMATTDLADTVSTAIQAAEVGTEAFGQITKSARALSPAVPFVGNALGASAAYDRSNTPQGFAWEMTKSMASGAVGSAVATGTVSVGVAVGTAAVVPAGVLVGAAVLTGVTATYVASKGLDLLDDVHIKAYLHFEEGYLKLNSEISNLYLRLP